MEPELVYCILRSKRACDLNSSRFTMLARSSLTAAVALRTVTPQPRAPARAAPPSACRSHFLVAARRGKARRVLPGPDPPPPPLSPPDAGRAPAGVGRSSRAGGSAGGGRHCSDTSVAYFVGCCCRPCGCDVQTVAVPVNVGCQQPLDVVCEPVTLVPARRRKVLATARAQSLRWRPAGPQQQQHLSWQPARRGASHQALTLYVRPRGCGPCRRRRRHQRKLSASLAATLPRSGSMPTRSARSTRCGRRPVRSACVRVRVRDCLELSSSRLAQVEKDLANISQAMATNETFARFVKDPCISRRTKTEAMEAATAGADETTRKMALVLCENGRLDEMPAVIADYSALMRAHRKEIEVTITSAEALDAEDLSMVKDALTNFKKEGESFIISEKVDSSLLGGVIVQLGDKYVDLSTIKRIREIERILQEPV